MKRFLLLAVLVLVVSGCSSQPQQETAVTGSEGVVFSVVSEPNEVFEGEQFSITYSLENVGASDVTFDDPGIISFSSNRLYLQQQGATSRFNSENFWLQGRTPFVSGESAFVTAFFEARDIDRSSQIINTGVITSICYPYESPVTAQVCLETTRDADPGSIICRNTPVTPSTPGAPVVVDNIVTRTNRVGDQILPSFRMNIRNAGSGIPSIDSCGSEGLDNVQGLNQVAVSATLLDEPLECIGSGQNGSIQLTNGRGIVTCSIPEYSSLEFGNSVANYLSVLSVNLTYSYRDSIRSDIRIVR